jgi:hypothetical protein
LATRRTNSQHRPGGSLGFARDAAAPRVRPFADTPRNALVAGHGITTASASSSPPLTSTQSGSADNASRLATAAQSTGLNRATSATHSGIKAGAIITDEEGQWQCEELGDERFLLPSQERDRVGEGRRRSARAARHTPRNLRGRDEAPVDRQCLQDQSRCEPASRSKAGSTCLGGLGQVTYPRPACAWIL